MSFDRETGQITYTLPEDALVRIRIGLGARGPLLRTLIDWEPRPAGSNIDIWDKKDSSGLVNFSDLDDVMVVLFCLPQDQKRRENYSGIVDGFRQSPRFDISFPGVEDWINGVPVLSGVVPVRVILNDDDKKYLTATRYEISFFTDHAFVSEDEEGRSPFTYQLNVTELEEGYHTFAVNVVGFAGEIGTKSMRVFVKHKG